jgi:acetyl esterase/lipase
MKKTIMALALTLMTLAAGAQTKVVKLWDNQSAPHSNNLTGPEKDEGQVRYSNTTEAVLYIFEAKKKVATGQAVVICPGGGYALVAMGHEGLEYGEWLAEQGITAAVLKYRMPNGNVYVPMEDAAEAIRYMKQEYPKRDKLSQVGISGFSAGGHLAASTGAGALEANGDTTARALLRPDFMVLFYPVISCDPKYSHAGSFNNLLGKGYTAETAKRWSPELIASEKTPQTLLILSDDDRGVKPTNSTLFYNRLKQLGIPASIHILPEGGHGWGMRDSFRYKPMWQNIVLDYLNHIKK